EVVEREQPHLDNFGRLWRERRARVAVDAPRDERRYGVIFGQRRARDALEERNDLRIEIHFAAASIFFRRSTKNGAPFIMRVSWRSMSGRIFVRYSCQSGSADIEARHLSRWSRLSYAHMCTIMLSVPTSVK